MSEERLEDFITVPSYTFFYRGFTLPAKVYPSYTRQFGLKEGNLVREITLVIGGKEYPAKIRVARIRTKRFPNRDVVQIFYDTQTDTLKALRKMFMCSYVTTIEKKRPRMKEIMQLEHLGGSRFKVVPLARRGTDFDGMFNFMEGKNLFDYWKERKERGEDEFFIYSSPNWLDARELEKYRNRTNVIYLLYHSGKKHLYVGKANRLGDRVKRGVGRRGLEDDWDRFMFFGVHPKYAAFLEQIEAFAIRTFASLVENEVGTPPLKVEEVKLVNRQLTRN